MELRVVDPQAPIASLATGPVVYVTLDASIGEVAAAMAGAGVSAAVVGRHAAAIVTEHDLTVALASGCGPADPVRAHVTRHVVRVDAATSIVEAAAVMLNREIRHLVTVGDDDAISVVSLRTVLAALLQAVEPRIWLESLRVAVFGAPTRAIPAPRGLFPAGRRG